MKKVIRRFKTGAVIPTSAIYLCSKEQTEAEHHPETSANNAYTVTHVQNTIHYFIVFEEEEKDAKSV